MPNLSDELEQPLPNKKPVNMTKEEFDHEMAVMELELKKLQLEDARDQIAKRKLERAAKKASHAENEASIASTIRDQDKRKAACNHRKGGEGYEVLAGNGADAADHALWRHILPNGDVWQRCLRCGKTVLPGDPDYKEFLKLPTKNKPSGSPRFAFTRNGQDAKAEVREAFRPAGRVN